MADRFRLGLVGVGKIARDQHVPAIAASDRLNLVATASRSPEQLTNVPGCPDLDAMIADHRLDAVTLCTPPRGRYAIAAAAIEAGLHVMVEKPPAATLSEVEDLAARARTKGVTLFTSWHSRAAAGVEPARAWLADKRVTGLAIAWRESIRRWHPGQDWILGPGGFGVLDPGINALSIVTRILPEPLIVTDARLQVPEGRHAPIAASVALATGAAEGRMELDFLEEGKQQWSIAVETDAGTLRLDDGGSRLELPGSPAVPAENREYANLYARFAELMETRSSDVDARPLQLVADILLVAAHNRVAPFSF